MKIIEIIKSFIIFYKLAKLEDYDNDIKIPTVKKEELYKIKNEWLYNLSKLIIKEDISYEYAKWYREWLIYYLKN